MTQPIAVYVRDVTSGRVHVRTRYEGVAELQSFESDNADIAGDVVEIRASDLADLPEEAFCNRCKPLFGFVVE